MKIKSVTLMCLNCQRLWPADVSDCVYQRETIEGKPCPACAAYTLSLRGPAKPPSRRRINFPLPRRPDAA